MKKIFTLIAAATIFSLGAQAASDLSYTRPDGTLYFGFSQSQAKLGMSIVLGPVFSPVTWNNTSNVPGATFEWSFLGNDNRYETVTNSPDGLTFTYKTDYSSELGRRNNLFPTPELACLLDGTTEEYKRGNYYQAGGTTVYVTASETANYGQTVFDVTEAPNGLQIEVAGTNTPVFGYNSRVNDFWKQNQFGSDATDADQAYVDCIMNLHTAPAAPIVINGAWILAKGHDIPNDAKFTLEIIGVESPDNFADGQVLASVEILGEEVIQRAAVSGTERNLCLPFTLAEPLVIDNTVCKYYLVTLSGFHSSAIPYFAPLMSTESQPDGIDFGFYSLYTNKDGVSKTETVPVATYTQKKQAFAIMLDAEWPWLYCTVTDVNLTDVEPATVKMDSYYELADLEVEGAPAWLKIEKNGRLGSTDQNYNVILDGVVKFSCQNLPEDTNTATVTISGPGVSHTFNVTAVKVPDSIETVAVASPAVKAVYNVAGMRVDLENATPGIYLQEMTDGSVRKIAVK